MKRAVFYSAILIGAASTTVGCPIFPNDTGCFSHSDCRPGFFCDHTTGACETKDNLPVGTCTGPDDCGANETCGRSGVCHIGDCSFDNVGCVAGFECGIDSEGAWSCLPDVPVTMDGGVDGAAGNGGQGGQSGASGTSGAGGVAGQSGSPGTSGAAGAGVAGTGNPDGASGSSN